MRLLVPLLEFNPRSVTASGELLARGVGQGDTARTSKAQRDHQPARQIDPPPYLLSKGYTVIREGLAELSVKALGREIYRLTREKNGNWIARKLGKLVGDIIQLVRRLEQRGGYAEALYRLTRGPTVTLQLPKQRAPSPRCPGGTLGRRSPRRRGAGRPGTGPQASQ
jgi:hypothetical protein